MNTRALLLFSAFVTLAACDDTAASSPDASPDVVADATPPGDVPSPDVATDATADVARDTTTGDAVSDVVRDATSDVTITDATADAPRVDVATDAVTDVSTDVTPLDAPSIDASGCVGSAPSCVAGTPGGTCGDALTVATCVSGAWRCADGMIFVSQCGCAGRPPGSGCTCTPSGWSCDAGTDAPDAAALDCNPAHVACDSRPPVCTGGGEVPSVSGACWGPCVLYTRCAPIPCDPDVAAGCPTNLVCYRTSRTCGPPL